MQAFRLTAPHTTELRAVPQPEPGPCHSDLHTIDAPDALGMPIPLTLGHEIAVYGTVVIALARAGRIRGVAA